MTALQVDFDDVEQGADWSYSFILGVLVTPTKWAAGATHAVGDVIIPTKTNNYFYRVEAITTGIAGASEPVWPLVPDAGVTVVDGGMTLVCQSVPILPDNLTGAHAHAQFRQLATQTGAPPSATAPGLDLTDTIVAGSGIVFGSDGLVTMNVAGALSAQLTLQAYVHDCFVTLASGVIRKALVGKVKVTPSVTHA